MRLPLSLATSLLVAACALPTPVTETTELKPERTVPLSRPVAKPAPTQTPAPGQEERGARPGPEATPQDCAGVAPVANEDGSTPRIAVLDSHRAVPGLGGLEGTLRAPTASIRLRTYPGSGAVALRGASVVFKWRTEAGEARTAEPPTLPVVPTTVPAASAGAWGQPTEVLVPLPTGMLRTAFAAELPATLEAEIRFLDERGFEVQSETLEALAVTIPLRTDATATPARPSDQPDCVAPARDEVPPPVALGDTSVPRVVEWTGLEPATGLLAEFKVERLERPGLPPLTNVTSTYRPDPPDVTIHLQAPPGSDGTAISAVQMTYEYMDASGAAHSYPLDPPIPVNPVTVGPARDDAYGAVAKIKVPIGSIQLRNLFTTAEARADGLVVARMRFLDAQGFEVQGRSLEPLEVRVPIVSQ